jgi:elongation factor G
MAQDRRRLATITHAVEVEFTHKKIIGGAGEFAKVKLRLEPLPRGTGIQFINGLTEGIIPDHTIDGVEEGIREAAKMGILAGVPVVDFKATLIGAAYHDIDSNRHTFNLAARGAFWDGMRKAGPKLL